MQYAQVVHFDHLGHHAVTCKYGGDVVTWHNMNRDILVETCRQTHIGVKVVVGYNLVGTTVRPVQLTY